MTRSPLRKGIYVVEHVLSHLFVFVTLVVGAVGVHHFIELLGDPTLFGVIRWATIADVSDFGLVVSFVVYGTLSFIAALTDSDEEEDER